MRLKIFTLTTLFLFSFGFAQAQCEITNGSFEEWFTTDFVIPDGMGGEASAEVLVPVGGTPFIRLLFLAFAAAFDPTYATLLETEAQELSGMSRSMDASDGDFALKLQGGYGIETADLYSLNTCNEVPEQFNFDVRHVGVSGDTLSVFVIFDQGLNALPETEDDLADVPAFASIQMAFDTTTEYQTVNLPVIQNFEAPVDTFYYVILAETFDENSYFLIDNMNFEGSNSGCNLAAPSISLTNEEEAICICNIVDVAIPLEYEKDPNLLYEEILINEDDLIISIDYDGNGTHSELCYPDGQLRAAVVVHDGSLTGLQELSNVSDFGGCYEISNTVELNTYSLPPFDFNVYVDGTDPGSFFSICLLDDLIETISFSSTSELENMAILLVSDEDSDTVVVRIDDINETTTFMGVEPGFYTLGAVGYDVNFDLEVGQGVEDISYDGCIVISEDIYEVEVLGAEDNCVTDVDDLYTGQLSINPNYSAGLFEINNPNNESYDFIVRDMSGRLIQQGNKEISNNKIDLTSFTNGLYIVSMNIEGYILQQKLVKM